MNKILFSLFGLVLSFGVLAEDLYTVNLDGFKATTQITKDSVKVINVTTSAVSIKGKNAGKSIAPIKGQLVGLEYGPSGDYKVQITNCPSFKGERFDLMICTVQPYVSSDLGEGDDVAVLTTTFDLEGGSLVSLGYFSGCLVYPSEGYKTIIKNGMGVTHWNALKCRIK